MDTLDKLFLALLKKERKAWQTQRKWKLGFISNHRNNRGLWHILSSNVGTLLIIIALQNPIPPRKELELQVNVECLNLLLFLLCKEREGKEEGELGMMAAPGIQPMRRAAGGRQYQAAPAERTQEHKAPSWGGNLLLFAPSGREGTTCKTSGSIDEGHLKICVVAGLGAISQEVNCRFYSSVHFSVRIKDLF